jgi:hypothetical protein
LPASRICLSRFKYKLAYDVLDSNGTATGETESENFDEKPSKIGRMMLLRHAKCDESVNKCDASSDEKNEYNASDDDSVKEKNGGCCCLTLLPTFLSRSKPPQPL